MIRKSHKNQEGEQGMKKWISRTLSIILSALMIVTSLPMEAFAAAQGVDAVIGDDVILGGDTSAAESDTEDTNEEGTTRRVPLMARMGKALSLRRRNL